MAIELFGKPLTWPTNRTQRKRSIKIIQGYYSGLYSKQIINAACLNHRSGKLLCYILSTFYGQFWQFIWFLYRGIKSRVSVLELERWREHASSLPNFSLVGEVASPTPSPAFYAYGLKGKWCCTAVTSSQSLNDSSEWQYLILPCTFTAHTSLQTKYERGATHWNLGPDRWYY